MYEKLDSMSVAPQLIKWVVDFLVGRLQFVAVNGTISDTLVINTGAPQGCCLSPTLFTLYTNDCVVSGEKNKLVKFADDSVLLGLIHNDDETEYREDIDRMVDWCDKNNLDLNVDKTMEMVCDFRRNKPDFVPIVIKDRDVACVNEYKYLGTTISADLSWTSHADRVVSKCHSRLYFLRKLKQFRVSTDILLMFYRASIESVLTFNCLVWSFGCSADDNHRLQRVIRQAEKVIGTELPSLEELVKKRSCRKVRRIMSDDTHPLFSQFELLPSGRRLRAAKCRTVRRQKSFVPSAISVMNLK
jgi:hypothetical protein